MHHPTTRTRLAALAMGLTLTTGVGAVAVPASAELDGELDGELHSLEHQQASGSVRSPDGALERGCESHGYRYRVNAEESDWSLELFLVDPDGETVANGYEWKGRDPARGRGRFEFCAQRSQAGTFKVRARLTWDDGAYHEKWLKPRTIRLRRG